jgi:putative CocE/NonD family hydrolase
VRYHDTTAKAESIEPGKIYAYDINLWATSNVFKAGHWIRLAISSNNFPRFNGNSNTGLPILGSRRMWTARQKIYHDAKHPSVVVLPIIPR